MKKPTDQEVERRARELRRQARRAGVPDSANAADAANFEILNEDAEWPAFADQARRELSRAKR